mmetsp:Transcript_44031/g.104247  ORF Transcript_44031/g.104247 Transcript_44031/m.104247 type:complete len:262 (-) Transcript_44031:3575-4360(-)
MRLAGAVQRHFETTSGTQLPQLHNVESVWVFVSSQNVLHSKTLSNHDRDSCLVDCACMPISVDHALKLTVPDVEEPKPFKQDAEFMHSELGDRGLPSRPRRLPELLLQAVVERLSIHAVTQLLSHLHRHSVLCLKLVQQCQHVSPSPLVFDSPRHTVPDHKRDHESWDTEWVEQKRHGGPPKGGGIGVHIGTDCGQVRLEEMPIRSQVDAGESAQNHHRRGSVRHEQEEECREKEEIVALDELLAAGDLANDGGNTEEKDD